MEGGSTSWVSPVRERKRLIVSHGTGLSRLNCWRSSIHGWERGVDYILHRLIAAAINYQKLVCCFVKEVTCLEPLEQWWISLRKAIHTHTWNLFRPRSACWILAETGWKTLFWLNCCDWKIPFRLKKQAEQTEYGISWTEPISTTGGLATGDALSACIVGWRQLSTKGATNDFIWPARKNMKHACEKTLIYRPHFFHNTNVI